MEQSVLKVKLNNIKLYNDTQNLKAEKMEAIDLILEYKKALELQRDELEKIKGEKAELEEKYNKIPEFIRNFF